MKNKADLSQFEEQKNKIENIYNIKNSDDSEYKAFGLTEEVIRDISARKEEPEWMLDIRLKALETYNKLDLPTWGPDLSEIDLNKIATYVKPKTDMKANWNDVPEDIKNTFEKLGIPEAEREALAGVGAQYDSEIVYHSIKKELTEQGVIYTDFESAVREYPEIIKEYFSKCISIPYHKFIALHYAVWSGGSFVYVPKGVKVDIPLQSYFRLNAAGAVELYVKDGATLRYSTIENWSKNMMNLNTKKAIVGKNAKIEWVSGSFGSKVSMLYPMSFLNGENASSEFLGISFAGEGQNLDTGMKIVQNAPNTSAVVNSKSISKDGGICTFRSDIKVMPKATGAKLSVSCESLMLDNLSKSDTIPTSNVQTSDVEFSHEAKIGKISDQAIFYLMTRGISEEEAKAMIVRGFADPISKALPLEYAVEMNNLINLELEGSIG